MKYNFSKIEKKWQRFWEKEKLFEAKDFSKKKKLYLLVEFPYPSSDGLHVGHVRSYTAFDIIARKRRMEGFNVLYPMGWDAFGLPTENYALKTGLHPKLITKRNIRNFKRQLKSLGLSFDWSREINTTDPNYYKWSQWIFLKLFENGLAYKKEMPINWCPSCKIGLANEEVIDGKCERCGTKVTRKRISQWLLKITNFADRLIEDLKTVDYLEKIKIQQINWIGKSVGTKVKFKIDNSSDFIEVFTTRVDTIFGVTALAVAPEHEIIFKFKNRISNFSEVEKYISEAEKKSDLERSDLAKEITGVKIEGISAINPINNQKIPIFVADYVLPYYGGGAVMVVPAHDERDYQLAKKYHLPIIEVVAGGDISKSAFTEYGTLINSSIFNGLRSEEAIEKITQYLKERGLGERSIQYKLRDWIFSRQHYWGEPIPLIFCENCKKRIESGKYSKNEFSKGELLNPGFIAVPEEKLPVKLPYVKKYQPTGTGESPLAKIEKWVKVRCFKCGSLAKRETDTMPNWAGSNWYYLGYLMKKVSKNLAFPISRYEKVFKYWMPVDWYNGGMEHVNLHLLYSRFIYKFLFDLGVVFTPEPYKKRTAHGVVLAEDGLKMSKSLGNVVNPDEIVKNYGADTLRIYEMFMGPFDQAIAWNSRSLIGCFRFLNRIWNLQDKVSNKVKNQKLKKLIHKTIKKVSEDIENLKFNTAVSALMILVNEMEKEEKIDKKDWEIFLKLISPFVPHLAEELWSKIGHKKSIFLEKWPKPDLKLIEEEKFELVIQINGKFKDKVEVSIDISEEEAKKLVLEREKVKKYLMGKKIKKVIFVPKKLINLVID
jgi:leucyl-tRNA synthetase